MSQTPPVDLPVIVDDVDPATPIWDELADRWAVVRTLQARTVDEEADRG